MGLVTAPYNRAGKGSSDGHVLLVALMAILLLGAALSLLAGFLVQRMYRVRAELERTRLTALVDAAMAETLANLASNSVYPGVAERELGDGSIRSEVRHGTGGSFVIRARADLRGRAAAVEARGRRTPTGPRVTSWRRLPPPEPAPGETHGGRSPPDRRR